jgi:hypothetical protein
MEYLVGADHNGTAHIPPEVTVKGFKKCCISKTIDVTDNDTLWNGSDKDGDVRTETGR